MKTVAEAQSLVQAAFAPLGVERMQLLAALGRFTANELYARCDAPAFDQSAMDGYAVRAVDLRAASADGPVTLPVHGLSRAGLAPSSALLAGTVMRIFTGAPLPEGADAVVLQEDTRREADRASFGEPARHHQHVRARGTDLRAGELLLPAGSLLGAGEIALLASQSMASVEVWRRPKVAIVCTGDELRDIGDPPRAASIINSNAYGLAAQVLEAGAEPWVLPVVPDSVEATRAAITSALRADVVLLCGGVSVGEYDFVRDALLSLDIALELWKVRLKPGKPLAFGRHGAVPVLGLPGNPVSAWVCFELFVRPGLRTMLGDPRPARRQVRVSLTAPLTRSAQRPEYARARLQLAASGRLLATLHRNQGSGTLPSIAGVDALVLLPEGMSAISEEQELAALVLREPGTSL